MRLQVLSAGQVGYIICNMKTAKEAAVGEILYDPATAKEALPSFAGFTPPKCSIYAGVFPVAPADHADLKVKGAICRCFFCL